MGPRRSGFVRHLGVPGRTAVVLVAAALGSLSPLAASAQTSTNDDSSGYYAFPPPVATSAPTDDGQPDQAYKQTQECVKRDLNNNLVLRDKPWGQTYLQIEEAQRLAVAKTGSAGGGQKVAVIDTGVTQHPYFRFPIVAGGDYVDPGKQGLEDCDGHGTEVAGIIAANTPADIGFKGVAPDAQIVSIRQTSQSYGPANDQASSSGGGNGSREQGQGAGNLATLAKAVVDAANRNVGVINMSVDNCRRSTGTISPQEQTLQAAIHYAVHVKNVVVVAAAGNVSDNCKQNDQANPAKPTSIVTPPWFSDDVLSVAAIDETGGVANFSVWGPWVSVAAPGTNITSLDPSTPAGPNLANQVVEGGKQQPIQGTSFAAPYVAGVAALVRAQFPTLDAQQVMHRIEATAQHPGAPSGRDNFIGYGVINPIAALTAIVPAEEGIAPAANRQLPPGLPPAAHHNWTPMIVALGGTGGGLVVLLVTLFVVHTIRRNRPA
ncbi:MAG TPA: type VII secretion-associated serine protease mycosin [Amycolatopsis sp.]|nr:type VII secretion-associated serine protease mycosin [Amycolatopsis sp.]